ncbi:MAG: hypothetical protein JO043_08245 [Candidatus Eremiobacteraeota bacterium]|nr:hypothetical protein [Candidatus Eremiobacteraeota bacterium]
MERLSTLRGTCAAVALSLGAAIPASHAQASPAGYLWLKVFSANAVGTSGQVSLSGEFVNDCRNVLPRGAALRILFNQGLLVDVPITVAVGQTQQFSDTVNVPMVPHPQNDVTAYRFVIVLPGTQTEKTIPPRVSPDMKTSPCLVTPALGTPSEP